MKLIFLNNNKVINVVTPPKENIEEYKQLILERGCGSQVIDDIREVEDELPIHYGYTFNKGEYLEPVKSDIELQEEKKQLLEVKANIDATISDIDTELNNKTK